MKSHHALATVIGLATLILCFSACKDNDVAGVSIATRTTPAFYWQSTAIQLDTAYNWTVTRYKNYIALTNYDEKCQYVLSWDGDLSDGTKTDAILQTSKQGSELQTDTLDVLTLENVYGTYYYFALGKGETNGTLVIEHY